MHSSNFNGTLYNNWYIFNAPPVVRSSLNYHEQTFKLITWYNALNLYIYMFYFVLVKKVPITSVISVMASVDPLLTP